MTANDLSHWLNHPDTISHENVKRLCRTATLAVGSLCLISDAIEVNTQSDALTAMIRATLNEIDDL